jgi:hypothetical protein
MEGCKTDGQGRGAARPVSPLRALRLSRPPVLFGLLTLCGSLSSVESAGAGGRVVLMVMDDLTVVDLVNLHPPHFEALAAEGAVGLVNVQSFSGASFHRGCLTLGAGARATGSELIGQAYDAWEPVDGQTAAAVYHQRTGLSVEGAAIVHLGVGPSVTDNARAYSPAHPGALGQALAEAGIECAVIGNSDVTREWGKEGERREAAAILMDAKGRVPRGDVSKSMLRAASGFPFGLRADHAAYLTELDECLRRCRVVVVDAGDTFRAEAFRPLATEEQGERLKEQSVRAADALLENVLRRLDLKRDLLLVLAPSIPITHRYQVAPILAAGPSLTPGSWLTSPSTRRPGLVTLTDVAPTLLAHLSVTVPPEFVGRPMSSCRGRGGWERLQVTNLVTAATDGMVRRVLLTPLGVWQGIVLLVGGLLLCQPSGDGRRRNLLRGALLSLVVVYVAVYLSDPLLHVVPSCPALAAVAALGLTVASAALLARSRWAGFPLATTVAGIAVGVFVLDAATGARLSLNSTLGYSSYFGGRYYGLGNIVACALIGAALLAAAGRHAKQSPRTPREWAAAYGFLAAVMVVVGHPRLGANVGCAAAAVVAFGSYLWVLSGRPVRARMMLVLAVAVVAILGLQVVADLLSGAKQESHLGQLVGSATREGASPVVQMVINKVQVFLRSFRHVYWTLALLGALAGWGAFQHKGPAGLRSHLRESVPLQALLWATLLGGLVALLLNDSGPACPAVIVSFGLAGAFLWLLDRGPHVH